MHDGPGTSLAQILFSREQRAAKQREWVNTHSLPLVSFTINMVGAIKKNRIAKVAFNKGHQAIVDTCARLNLTILKTDRVEADTGYELLLLIDTSDVHSLKRAMVEIEETHCLGRLFDIDVIGTDYHPLSRQSIDQPRRRCLICEQEAKSCIRQQNHSVHQLIKKMTELINACQ